MYGSPSPTVVGRPSPPTRPGRSLAIVGLVFYTQIVVLVTMPVAAVRGGTTPTVVGLLLAIPGAVSVIADMPGAALSDAVGRRRVVMAGGAILVATGVVLAAARDALGLFLGMLLLGISMALLVAPSLAHLTEIVTERPQSSIQGTNGSVQAGASIAAAVISGALLGANASPVIFLTVSLVGAAIVGLALGLQDSSGAGREPPRFGVLLGSYRAGVLLLRSPFVLLATALAVAYGLLFLVIGNGFVPAFAISLGVPAIVVGVALAIRTVVVAVVSPTYASVTGRYGSVAPVYKLTMVGALGAAIVAATGISPVALLAAVVLQGLGIAYAAAAANIWVAVATPTGDRALAIATSNLGSRVALLVTPPLLGASVEIIDPAAPFLIGAIVLTGVAFWIRRLGRRANDKPDAVSLAVSRPS